MSRSILTGARAARNSVASVTKNKKGTMDEDDIILGDERDLDMKELSKFGPVRRISTKEIFGY